MCGLPLTCPPLGTWPTTQAFAPTRTQTCDPLVHRLMLNPLSHTSQGCIKYILNLKGMGVHWNFVGAGSIGYVFSS